MTDHDCSDVLAELNLYLDREMGEIDLARVEVHLRRCSPCLEAFDFEAELRRIVARGCRERASEELRARILEALEACAGEVERDEDVASPE